MDPFVALAYPAGFAPNAEDAPWRRAVVIYAAIGAVFPAEVRVPIIARIAKTLVDYEKHDQEAILAATKQ